MKPQWQRMGHAAEAGSYAAQRMAVAREVYALQRKYHEPRLAWQNAWCLARMAAAEKLREEAREEARMAKAYAEWVASHPEEWGNPADEENY